MQHLSDNPVSRILFLRACCRPSGFYHLSGTAITDGLQRPTPRASGEQPFQLSLARRYSRYIWSFNP